MNKVIIFAVAGLVATMGCRRPEAPGPEARMTELRETVTQLSQSGDGTAVRSLLEAAMVDASLQAHRGECLSLLIDSLLGDDLAAEAEATYLAAVADPVVARGAYGRVGGYYYRVEALPELAAWLTTLLDAPTLSTELKVESWRRYTSVCQQTELLPSIIDRVPYLVAFDVGRRPSLVGAGGQGTPEIRRGSPVGAVPRCGYGGGG